MHPCFHQFLCPQQETNSSRTEGGYWKIWFSLLGTGTTKSKEPQNTFAGTVTEL